MAAMQNGVVAPKGQRGIIRSTATEVKKYDNKYLYKVKILRDNGDMRILGYPLENGLIYFDKITYH